MSRRQTKPNPNEVPNSQKTSDEPFEARVLDDAQLVQVSGGEGGSGAMRRPL
jgi:hypothetical protein